MPDDYSSTILTTGTIVVGNAGSGDIEVAGDTDWFAVTLTGGQTYQFFMVGSQFGGTLPNTLEDPLLRVLNSQGAVLAFDDNGWGNNAYLSFTAPQSGTYFLEASSGLSRPTVTGTYQLSVKPFATAAEQADFLVNGWFEYVAVSGNGDSPTPRQWEDSSVSVNISGLTSEEQGVVLTVLQLYSDVADIAFTITAGAADITYINTGSGNAQIANWTVNGPFFTSVTVNVSSDFSPVAGVNTPMFQAYLHETGHALGLGHSGPYAGGSPAFGFANLFGNDTLRSTVMTYFGWPGQPLHDHVITPQMADIYAVQSMYGANTNTRLGDTIYGFNSNAGAFFDFATYGPLIAFTFYDSGGNDTLDASGYAMSQRIDLGPGQWSSIGGALENIGIYLTSVIENAVGGGGADEIIGNAAANILVGGGGADWLDGAAGADISRYAAASSSASWHRNPDGTWTVVSTQGTDTLTSVEFAEFTDRTVHLDRAAQTFSGDGTSDLLLRNSAGTLSIWFIQGGAITGGGMGSISADWTPQSGDFNGDGRDDILWRNTSNGAMSMWFMNGLAVTGASFGNVGTNWVIEGLGDFNGDTRDDILWRDTSSGAMSLWFLNGQAVSGGAFGSITSNWAVEALGDFNGDGRDDILWRDTSTGSMSIFFMNGQAVTGGAFGNVNAAWVVEGAGDFNGDGRDDIFWRNSTTGDVSLWLMNGLAVTGTAGFGISTAWDTAALGDYNGDGSDDVIWRDGAGNMVAWFINGTNITGQSLGALSTDWVINPGG